jgi:hypothetical protein
VPEGWSVWEAASVDQKAPQLCGPGSLRKKYAGIVYPPTWYAAVIILPHLGVTGSQYYAPTAEIPCTSNAY